MLRRSLLINLCFSCVSTAVMLSAIPSVKGLTHGLWTSFMTYAQDSALLSPLVHRTLSLR